jgi:hypothetical protein
VARRSLTAPAALAALALILVLAPAAGADGIRIVSPKLDRFFAAAPIWVKVKTPKSVRSLAASVERKGVSSAFEQVRPGLWRAKLGTGALEGGANHLVVSSRGRTGDRDYAATRFLVGQRKRGLLTLAGPGQGRSLVAQVRVAAPPQRLSAKLNGKRLRWPLGISLDRSEALRLGADDGLRFGVNRLQVLAIRGDGAFDVERRSVVVPRTRPLAGAGRDRRTAAGTRLRLDGRSSRPAGEGSRLSYRWKIIRKPRGSKANLRGGGTARPLLRADKPGVYRAQLLVTEPGRAGGRPALRAAADTVTVTSVESLPPIGAPIETIAYNGKSGKEADTGIRIGAKTYWLGLPQGNAYQAVMLERDTLAPLYVESFPGFSGSAIEKLAEKIKQYGKKALVVISFPNLEGETLPNLGLPPIARLLGADITPLKIGQPGWSVVGVPGTKEGAYLGAGSNRRPQGAGDVRGNLSGYLQQTSSGNFAFAPASRVLFDTAAPGAGGVSNTIKVGSAEYPSVGFPACGSGGFQVQVLLAETLAPAGAATFLTNGCGAVDDKAEQQRMAAYLGSISTQGEAALEGPKLVLVQSIGSPYDPAAGSWGAVATALARLGGTASVAGAARAGYALVGGVGIGRLPLTEASETLTGARARITGVLKPDRLGSHAPMLSSPSGSTDFGLTAIAYQPSQPWPASQGKGEKAALAYVATTVLKLEAPALGVSCYVPAQPDVRSQYCNLQYENKWSGYATKLEGWKFEAGHGFGKAEWEAVVKELAGEEFETVQSVWTLVHFLQSAFGVAGSTGQVKLDNIAAGIEKAITPPAQSEAAGWWLELFGNFGSVGSYFSFGFEGEYVQKVLGVLQGIIFESAASIYESNGEPLLEEWRLDASDVAVELADRYQDASTGIAFVGELLVSDYGKLQAVRKSGLLGISAKGFGKTTEALELGAEQWSYQALLPAAYEAVGLTVGGSNGPPLLAAASDFECNWEAGRAQGFWHPFPNAPISAELRSTEPTETLGLLVRAGSKLPSDTPDEVRPASPTKALLAPLVEPGEAGAPYHAPWFWRQAFGYPSGQTKNVFC